VRRSARPSVDGDVHRWLPRGEPRLVERAAGRHGSLEASGSIRSQLVEVSPLVRLAQPGCILQRTPCSQRNALLRQTVLHPQRGQARPRAATELAASGGLIVVVLLRWRGTRWRGTEQPIDQLMRPDLGLEVLHALAATQHGPHDALRARPENAL